MTYVLMAAVAVVWLIACANVAGLMLAHCLGRAKESVTAWMPVTKVEQNRWFWRPDHPRIVLIAEFNIHDVIGRTRQRPSDNGLHRCVPS